MLRTKKKQLNLKPNRQLDKRSSRGMLYENEELRLRTIHINDEVDKGQTDIKKLRKENEYLKREIWSLRDECSKLEDVLKKVYSGNPPPLSELPTYQPRVRKQSTFSGMWGGGRRGSNMSFSNCSSYDYEIENDTDNLNQENENDPDMINNYELGQGQALISGDQDSLEHSKKPASRQNSSQQVQQPENGGLTTHVNWEDQQEVHQVDVYLVPGQQSDDNGDAHSLDFENIENQQQQQDYCLNQHVVLTHQNQHQHHNHNNHNLWQMHSPDLEAVTEESENASNSNNSNSNSNPAMVGHAALHNNNNIPKYHPDISVSNSNSSINNFGLTVSSSSVVGGNNFICIDHIDMDHTNSSNDSALFEALAFESMNCSLERIDNYNPIMDHQAFPVPCVTNTSGFLNLEPIPVRGSSSNLTCNNNYFRPIIEITPARSSPTSTTASSSGNGVGGRSSTATPPSKQFATQNVDEREREERERSNSSASATGSGSGNGGGDPGLSNNNNSANTNSNQNQNQDHHLHHQTYPGSISASGAGADFRDDVYHNLGCVTEIPKKYQVTSELKINVSRTNSSSSLVEQISSASSAPGLPDDGHTNSGSGGSVGCSSAGASASAADNNKKTNQVSSSGAQPQQEQLRYHPVLNKPSNCSTISGGTVTTITRSSANTGDESYCLSQVRQNQFTTHNQTSVFYNHDRERDLAEAETDNPVAVATKSSINNNSSGSGTGSGSGGASYRVLKIYSTYLSKTQQKTKRRPSSSSCSNNNNADSQSFSQSEPNLNSQDIFQFGTSSQPPPFGHRHGYEDEGPMSDIVGGGGWGPRNGQLTCRKLQGWSRSCCHTNSVVCSCHTNSRTNLNPFEMCSCNCASENPHINLKDDWNVFDRNIVIGLLMDEGRDRDNKDILSTSQSPPVSFRYLSVQEVIDELESQFDSTLENTQGVRLLTLPDFHPCRIFISVRNAGSVRTLIERGLTVRGQRMRLIDASQNAFSFIILSGLPSSFPDSSIISVLNEFGQVVAPLQRRVYKGVDTTERIARMHLVRIPPTSQIPLNIAGYEVLAKFVSQSQNPPSHEIPMSSSSVLSTANDMISTHAVLTCTSSGGSNAGDTGISTAVGSGSASAAAATASGATTVPAGMNSLLKNYSSSLPTPTTVESGPGPGVIIQRGNKSPVPPALAIGPHGAGPVPVPGPGSASPTMSSIPRPHKPVTRSTTLDSALATSTGHPGGSSLQLQNNFQVQPSTNTNSRFGLGPTAAAISKRNMSICGSLLDCPATSSTTAENGNNGGNGQKNGLLGNPKKPLSRLLRSSPGSLVPPSPGPGPGGGMQLLGGDGSGLIAGGAGAGAGRPLSRSMSFEPRRPSGNGKALAVGSQLSLVDSHKLNNQGGSTGNFPLNDSIGSGNGLSRQQSRIFQQHRKLSQASSARFRNSIDKTKEELPWCGCWGNGCI